LAYKRSIYIINPKFQFRVAFFVCIIVCFITLAYGWTILDLINTFSAYLGQQDPKAIESIARKKNALILLLGGFQIGFLGLTFVACLIISHQIAGPMYKLKLFLKAIREEDKVGTLYFRKKDFFHDVADSVNETMGFLSEQRTQDFMYLSEVNSYLKNLEVVLPDDKKVVLQEISSKLSQIQTRFNQE